MANHPAQHELDLLQEEIVSCNRCPRLVRHREAIAITKRRAYLDWEYWGRPVPSFGDRAARLLVVGLAPGAHGANRTGRVFTGDASGDFLYDALFRAGFASHPQSNSSDDGLTLTDCYISCAVRCVPPGNRPTPLEFATCRDFLEREITLLPGLLAVMALGRMAYDSYLAVVRKQGVRFLKKDIPFAHGASYRLPGRGPVLLCSYHPSQQNTQTGRLNRPMMMSVLRLARDILASSEPWSTIPRRK